MWLLLINILFILAGFFLFMLTKLMPVFEMVYFDYIGLGVVACASVFTIMRLFATRSYYQADKAPKWEILINYMRRDNVTVPIHGKRAYPGESFLDVPHLGLIEFLGRDCYYQWGDKKYMWGLENINFSPDPRYSNLCNTLWSLGVKNSDELKRVLNIDRLEKVYDYDLFLMGKMYVGMIHWENNHGANRLVNDMRSYNGETISFESNKESFNEKIDRVLANNPYR